MAQAPRDFTQVLKGAWRETDQALAITPSGDASNPLPVSVVNSLVPEQYNEIDLTYITSGNGTGQIGTVTYKLAGVQQAMLTLTYDTNNNLITVVKS